jgi:hypothetical protein
MTTLWPCLHPHEPHRRLGYRFADGFCIQGIGLATLDIGLHVGWGHKPAKVRGGNLATRLTVQ